VTATPTYQTQRSPDRYTDGPAFGLGIARWLGRRPTAWQQAVLDVGLERLDGPGSPFAFDSVAVIVGRRAGKTVTSFGVPLIRALAGPVTLPNGRIMPFKATHTAQNLHSARQRFAEDLVDPYRRRFSDIDWPRAAEFKRAAADTTLTIDPIRGRRRKNVDLARQIGRASELRVLAPTSSSARGAGVLHRTVDEYLTFTRERGEDMDSAARPTMSEMQGLAQQWIVSNVATSSDEHTHLWHVRNKGRAAVESDRRDGICYVEFSLPPDADPDDERSWWKHYPGLADGIVGIRQLRRDREELGATAFAAEFLCRWPDETPGGVLMWPVITENDWTSAATTAEIPADAIAVLGVDIDPFGRSSTIVAAAADPDRPGVLVEVVDHRPGSTWVADAVRTLARGVAAVAVDDYGPGHDLILALRDDYSIADRIVPMKGPDFVSASYAIDRGLREGTVRYRPHPALTAAAAAAQRTTGKGWIWERRVKTSQAPLVAASLAAYALDHADAPMPDPAIF
jgi:hypothetical protein